MSADSLNASPIKKPPTDSPIDDKTFTKHDDDDKQSNCERISQVSPFIISPTTENSDFVDNGTGVSTLSKTTVPTDAKSSKPSETQCLSKATSIDSWCSNDTLYNVEENFDDLAMDPDVPLEFEKDEHSESSHTLTHNDEDRELSHCSTYIVHDSKSEACETFSPDSITANDNYTYTKAKTDMTAATPSSIITKSEVDSAKNTQTILSKDLAYGTLMSGVPSYSNCTTEVASAFDDVWKMQQPEMIRRSPMGDEIDVTPPRFTEEKYSVDISPQIVTQPCINKMDSVDISCLHDNLAESHDKSEDSNNQNADMEALDSSNIYKTMAPSVTSTPLTEVVTGNDDDQVIPMELPDTNDKTPDFMSKNLPNFQTFLQSAEVRPQDLSPCNVEASSQETEILLEGDSKTLSRNSNRDSMVNDRTPNYSDFENSAICKPQDVNSRDKSSQSMESGMNSEEFTHFESSVRNRPQDLSSVIDASSLLLNSERRFSALAITNSTDLEQTSQSGTQVRNHEQMKSLDVSPPNSTFLIESQYVDKSRTTSNFFIQADVAEETDQPHSIIITENDELIKESPNRTYDSHTEAQFVELNHTYDSHETQSLLRENLAKSPETDSSPIKVNGITELDDEINIEKDSPKLEEIDNTQQSKNIEDNEEEANVTTDDKEDDKEDDKLVKSIEEIKCNGSSEKYATVQFLNETFEELIESNVDDGENKELPNDINETSQLKNEGTVFKSSPTKDVHDISKEKITNDVGGSAEEMQMNGTHDTEDEKLTSVTENFLQNEKNFCQLDSYLPLLSDIRFTGPASEIMTTSFTQDSPTEPTSPEREQDGKSDVAADILKEWDSDSDSHSTNSSSGEFIWKVSYYFSTHIKIYIT
ncbi:unnamed protein product [Diatraea saccharalis]|nr:unnamed protein product [Diatraea saccharalis]